MKTALPQQPSEQTKTALSPGQARELLNTIIRHTKRLDPNLKVAEHVSCSIYPQQMKIKIEFHLPQTDFVGKQKGEVIKLTQAVKECLMVHYAKFEVTVNFIQEEPLSGSTLTDKDFESLIIATNALIEKVATDILIENTLSSESAVIDTTKKTFSALIKQVQENKTDRDALNRCARLLEKLLLSYLGHVLDASRRCKIKPDFFSEMHLITTLIHNQISGAEKISRAVQTLCERVSLKEFEATLSDQTTDTIPPALTNLMGSATALLDRITSEISGLNRADRVLLTYTLSYQNAQCFFEDLSNEMIDFLFGRHYAKRTSNFFTDDTFNVVERKTAIVATRTSLEKQLQEMETLTKQIASILAEHEENQRKKDEEAKRERKRRKEELKLAREESEAIRLQKPSIPQSTMTSVHGVLFPSESSETSTAKRRALEELTRQEDKKQKHVGRSNGSPDGQERDAKEEKPRSKVEVTIKMDEGTRTWQYDPNENDTNIAIALTDMACEKLIVMLNGLTALDERTKQIIQVSSRCFLKKTGHGKSGFKRLSDDWIGLKDCSGDARILFFGLSIDIQGEKYKLFFPIKSISHSEWETLLSTLSGQGQRKLEAWAEEARASITIAEAEKVAIENTVPRIKR